MHKLPSSSWREVKGPNSRLVLAGHKRACCFFAGQYEQTGLGTAVDFGTFCDGVREEDDGSIVVVHEPLDWPAQWSPKK